MIAAVLFGVSVSATGIRGDVNGDGSVNNKDVVALFRFVSEVEITVTEENCDVNGDSAINNKDVTVLFRLVSGVSETLDLRLLQFNVQTENGTSTPFSTRAGMYRKFVDEIKPDVVGMQEVTVNWRRYLDSTVFGDGYASIGEPRTRGGEANPIYYRKDKFEFIDGGTFWLSDTPDVAGSYLEGVNYPRICTWVILKDRASGIRFIHLNTHLDHNGNNDSTTGNNIRKAQLSVIIRFAQQYVGMPMFLSGDLNNRRTTSKNKTYALIKHITGESKYKYADGEELMLCLADSRLDAEKTMPDDRIATMTKYFDESGTSYEPAREPIDYIFYDPITTKALTYETFLIKENGSYISDHLPVFATFRIGKKAETE